MCKGTRCTHDSDPAVECVEEPYDTWEYVYVNLTYDDEGEATSHLIRVAGRRMHSNRDVEGIYGGPGHDQPVIQIKDDLGPYWDKTDEQMTRFLWCQRCELDSHECYSCGVKVTHAGSGTCEGCWWNPSDTARVRSRPLATSVIQADISRATESMHRLRAALGGQS